MKSVKNFLVGFAVSFIGSLPFGHLNLAGFSIQQAVGDSGVAAFLAGVLIPEAVVVYFSSVFADRIAQNQKLLKILSFVSILFLLVLAVVFFLAGSSGSDANAVVDVLSREPFVTGFTLSCLNFVQIPFWVGWNIYLASSGTLRFNRPLIFLYLAGTLIGTFAGMAAFIYSMDLVAENTRVSSGFVLTRLVPLIFLLLAVFQGWNYYKKFGRNT